MRAPLAGDVAQINVGDRRVNGIVVYSDGEWCRVVVPGSDADSRILPLQWHDRPVESVVVQPRPRRETPGA